MNRLKGEFFIGDSILEQTGKMYLVTNKGISPGTRSLEETRNLYNGGKLKGMIAVDSKDGNLVFFT